MGGVRVIPNKPDPSYVWELLRADTGELFLHFNVCGGLIFLVRRHLFCLCLVVFAPIPPVIYLNYRAYHGGSQICALIF